MAPLIGEGKIGGAFNAQNEMTRNYKIENGQFNNTGRIVCEMDNLPKIEPSEKVAVLLSRYTISSGEMVAVTFKGQKRLSQSQPQIGLSWPSEEGLQKPLKRVNCLSQICDLIWQK